MKWRTPALLAASTRSICPIRSTLSIESPCLRDKVDDAVEMTVRTSRHASASEAGSLRSPNTISAPCSCRSCALVAPGPLMQILKRQLVGGDLEAMAEFVPQTLHHHALLLQGLRVLDVQFEDGDRDDHLGAFSVAKRGGMTAALQITRALLLVSRS